jgi:hypothetical protein
MNKKNKVNNTPHTSTISNHMTEQIYYPTIQFHTQFLRPWMHSPQTFEAFLQDMCNPIGLWGTTYSKSTHMATTNQSLLVHPLLKQNRLPIHPLPKGSKIGSYSSLSWARKTPLAFSMEHKRSINKSKSLTLNFCYKGHHYTPKSKALPIIRFVPSLRQWSHFVRVGY